MLPALIYILCVILPIVFWFWFFRQEDRAEPEPRKLLFKTFLLGMLTAVLLALAERLIFSAMGGMPDFSDLLSHSMTEAGFFMMALAGPIEELGKFAVLKEYVYDKDDFNQIADGVVYAVTLALGFAFIENTGYFFDALKQGSTQTFVTVAVMRGLLSVALHISSASIIGLALARKKFRPQHAEAPVWLAVVAAATLHATYNTVTQFGMTGLLIIVLLLSLVLYYIIRTLHMPETKVVWRRVIQSPIPQKSAT